MLANEETEFLELCESGNCEAIKEFSKVNKTNLQKQINKALNNAVKSGNADLLKTLLDLEGSNPSFRGNQPLRAAIFSCNTEIIDIILNHPKMNMMHKCYKVLKATANNWDIVVIRKILEKTPPRYLFNMWYHYISTGNIIMLSKFKLLMEQWFFLNAKDTKEARESIENFGYTSLTYAANIRCLPSINYLVDTFVQYTNKQFLETLHLYVQNGYNQLLKIIFDKMKTSIFELLWRTFVVQGDVLMVDFILKHYGNNPSVDIYKALYLAKTSKNEDVAKRICKESDFRIDVYKRYVYNILERSNSGE